MWNAALEVYKPAGRLSTDRGWRIPATAEWAKMELAAVLDLRLTGATICVLAHPITWTLRRKSWQKKSANRKQSGKSSCRQSSITSLARRERSRRLPENTG